MCGSNKISYASTLVTSSTKTHRLSELIYLVSEPMRGNSTSINTFPSWQARFLTSFIEQTFRHRLETDTMDTLDYRRKKKKSEAFGSEYPPYPKTRSLALPIAREKPTMYRKWETAQSIKFMPRWSEFRKGREGKGRGS